MFIIVLTVVMLVALLPVGLAFMVHVRIVRGQHHMLRNHSPEHEARAGLAALQEEQQRLRHEACQLHAERDDLIQLIRRLN